MTGIVLTRVDGDGRGGAALSMRAVTGKPIKLIGIGERIDALEDFYPSRIADRILGMGDIITLVEKAAATIDAEKAARAAEKMRKGAFDLCDLREQLMQMQQMGGMTGLMGMLPGIAKMKNQLAAANLDERVLKRQVAIIDSMTPQERRNPEVLKASRKKRIAAGSGTRVEDINRMLKMHRTMVGCDEGDGRGQAWADGRLWPTCWASAAACRARSRCSGWRRRCRAACRACRARGSRLPGPACRRCLACPPACRAVRCCPGSAASRPGSADCPASARRNSTDTR